MATGLALYVSSIMVEPPMRLMLQRCGAGWNAARPAPISSTDNPKIFPTATAASALIK